jgi:probable HAF family extracellular repeat protein
MFANLWSTWLNQLRHNRRAYMIPVSHSGRARRALRRSRTASRLALEGLESRVLLSSYIIEDLGTLGGNSSQATAINAQGDVVGSSQLGNGTTHAVLWASRQPAQDLGTLGGSNSSASAINILGEIVGSADSASAQNQPFDLQPGGKMTNLNSEVPPNIQVLDSLINATGVNDTGVIVGQGSFNEIDLTETAPYSFDPPSGTLNQLDFSGAIGQATAVAGTKAVASLTNFSSGNPHAVVEDINKPDSSVALPGLTGFGDQSKSFVTSISASNSSGTQFATGLVTIPGNPVSFDHLVLWTIPTDPRSATVSDLSVAYQGFQSTPLAVNAGGDIVGTTPAAPGLGLPSEAFIWPHDGSFISLTRLLPADAGITLTNATGINDSGQICADGTINGQSHAFLLTPVVPPPPDATLISAPDINSSTATYSFVVTYTVAAGIDTSTLQSAIRVTGPNGFGETASLASTSGPSTQLAATYTISPPGGGTWNASDNGTYTITLNNNVAKDTTGQPLAGGKLGNFVSAISIVRASVSGKVFNDTNENGVQDLSEGGVANTDVFIDLNGDGRFDSGDPVTQTDIDGNYSFNGLLPDTYRIMQAVIAPQAVDSPTGGVNVVKLSPGQNLTNLAFGDVNDPEFLSINGHSAFVGTFQGTTAQFDQPATVLHITGFNFQPLDVLYFGNDQATVVLPGVPTKSDGSQTFDVSVPQLATTGAIVAFDPHSKLYTTLLHTFIVDSYRNVNGYSFVNDGVGYSDFSFDDLTAVYGADQTDITVDACGILTLGAENCTVDTGVASPLALAELAIINEGLPPGAGECVGFSLSSARLSLGIGPTKVGAFLQTNPGSAATVWDLASPSGPLLDLRQLIHRAHLEQTSDEFLGNYVSQIAADEISGVSHLINGVKSQLAKGLPVLIAFQEGGLSGHCVLAYNVQDNPNGSETLDIYDPDTPFLASEDNAGASPTVPGVVDGTEHAQNVQASTITFGTDGHWIYNGGAGTASGGMGSIAMVPLSVFNSHTLLASSITSLLTLGVFGSAAETQVTDSAGHTLLNADGSPNTDPKTMIPNAARFIAGPGAPPLDLVAGTGSFMQTITGTGGGTYSAASLSNDAMAMISGVTTIKGQTDQFGLDPSNDKFTFIPATTKTMAADLVINAPGGVQRQAQLTATAAGGAAQTIQFLGSQRDHVVFSAVGASTFSLNLTSNADGLVQTFTTGRMTLAAGDSVDLLPSDWADIQAATATVVVHHADGSKTTSTMANGGAGLQVNAKEGVSFTASVASFTNQTAAGKSAVINWGDGATSTGTVAASGANLTVTGSHTYASQGYFPTRITLSDASGPVAQATGEAVVAFTRFTLAPANISAFAGVPFTGTVATLTDTPSGEVASDFALKINWGDGKTSTGTLQTTSPGQFLVTGSHTWATSGTRSVTVTVTENSSAAGQGHTLHVASHTVFSGTVAQLQMPIPGSAPSDYVATINWGDHSTSTGTLTLQSDGSVILSGRHSYATRTNSHVTHFTLTGGPSASTTSAAVASPPLGTVTGTLFDDVDGNGTIDPGEKGIPDQTVFIDEKNDGKLDPGDPFAVTNSAGVYTIANVPAGTIHVRERVPKGYRVAAPASGSYKAALHAGQTLSNLDFADTQRALISGTVFVDRNGNGKRAPADPGRANQIVYLDLSNSGVLEPNDPTVLTDATGAFAFTVHPGTYVVRLQSFSNLIITAPIGGAYSVTVGEGATNSRGLFGELLLNGAPVQVQVVDSGGNYTGKPFAARATAVGSDGKTPVAGSFRFAYFAGSSASGTPLSAAPINAGTYTVVAIFISTKHNPTGGTAQTTFTISPAPIRFTIGNDAQAFGWPANLAADLAPTFHTGVNGETLHITYSSSGATSTARPGTYTITGVISKGTGLVSNYAVKLTNGTLTVLDSGVTVVGTTLFIVGGTTGNDNVQARPIGSRKTGGTGVLVTTMLNNVPAAATFNQSFTAVHIFLYGGNDSIQLAPTLTINTTVNAGNGNDNILLGNGANTVTLGNGNDNVLVGNGNNVVVTGNGTDKIVAGNGDNLIVAGLGKHSVQAGNGSNILIDGSARLTQSGDSLRGVLNDWQLHGDRAANVARIRARLRVTDNTTSANTLRAGSGLDWFFETSESDSTNRKPTDLLN